jgi:hypothetical protein
MLEVRRKGVDFNTRFFHSSFLLHKKTLNLKKVALWPNYARNPEGRVAFFPSHFYRWPNTHSFKILHKLFLASPVVRVAILVSGDLDQDAHDTVPYLSCPVPYGIYRQTATHLVLYW